MDIIRRIDIVLGDQAMTAGSGATTTANVATNLAKGHVDVVGGECPKGQRYDLKRKVCVPAVGSHIKKWIEESSRNPKAGDRFEYKGKKLSILMVGSGMGHDKYIEVQFDKEKHPRSISMKNFFKGNEFKYIKESSVVGGSYISNTTVNIIGSGQTRTWGVKSGDGPQRGGTRGVITDLARKNKGEVISSDKTVENLGRRGLRFNHVLGAYVPDQWEEKYERMD